MPWGNKIARFSVQSSASYLLWKKDIIVKMKKTLLPASCPLLHTHLTRTLNVTKPKGVDKRKRIKSEHGTRYSVLLSCWLCQSSGF